MQATLLKTILETGLIQSRDVGGGEHAVLAMEADGGGLAVEEADDGDELRPAAAEGGEHRRAEHRVVHVLDVIPNRVRDRVVLAPEPEEVDELVGATGREGEVDWEVAELLDAMVYGGIGTRT